MQRLTIRFSIFSVLAALLLVSCGGAKITDGYSAKPGGPQTFNAPYFSDAQTDYVYKANITIYGHELTGIFIAKKLNETTHRVVFTTEFGNKLIDFEISDTDFKLHSIVSELDRKLVINTLKEDFRLLLKKQFNVVEQFENPQHFIYRSADGNRSNYLFVSKNDGKLLKIIHASPRKEKINLSFTAESDILAQKIVIAHRNIKLRIELNYFKPN